MSFITLKEENGVFVLTLDDPQNDNTFSPEVFDEYDAVLDEIEASTHNASLLITSSSPKTWCNGINLNWFMANTQETTPFIDRLDQFLLRVALLNLPTVGSLVGNTYAGGALFASALDFRFMRGDRGRFCFSEIDIKMAFTPTMIAIIELLPNKQALNELALTGIRVGGETCREKQIVDHTYNEEELYGKSFEYAKFLSDKDRTTYGLIKHRLRKELVAMRDKRDNP